MRVRDRPKRRRVVVDTSRGSPSACAEPQYTARRRSSDTCGAPVEGSMSTSTSVPPTWSSTLLVARRHRGGAAGQRLGRCSPERLEATGRCGDEHSRLGVQIRQLLRLGSLVLTCELLAGGGQVLLRPGRGWRSPPAGRRSSRALRPTRSSRYRSLLGRAWRRAADRRNRTAPRRRGPTRGAKRPLSVPPRWPRHPAPRRPRPTASTRRGSDPGVSRAAIPRDRGDVGSPARVEVGQAG